MCTWERENLDMGMNKIGKKQLKKFWRRGRGSFYTAQKGEFGAVDIDGERTRVGTPCIHMNKDRDRSFFLFY